MKDDIEPAALPRPPVPDRLSLHHAADVPGGGGPDHRRHRAARHRRLARRRGARVLGRRRLSGRRHHRRARLWPAARRLRRQAHDVRRARHLPRRLAAVRRLHQHRDAEPCARPAGPRRRRADDAVAGAHRRDHPAARARPLPGLPGRRDGHVQHLRTRRRRLSHASFRLAQRVPHQPAARRDGGRSDPAPGVAARARAALDLRQHGASSCSSPSSCRRCWRWSRRSA